MGASDFTSAAEQRPADRLVDAAEIRAALEYRLAELIDLQPTVPPSLKAAANHALLGQSKRVRPVMMYLIADPDPDLDRAVLDAGCAVEMVHTASLILDDLPCMDDAQLRRQRPATHIAFGQPTAILVAIALLTRAFGILADLHGVEPAVRNQLATELSTAVGWDGLVAGQEIDVNNRASLKDGAKVEELNWLKTGILFVAAAKMGAILRGLDGDRLNAVSTFARHFGLAFQTADDLIDKVETAEVAGKDVGKDQDKATLVSLFGAEHARSACLKHLSDAEMALIASGIDSPAIRALMARLVKPKAERSSL